MRRLALSLIALVWMTNVAQAACAARDLAGTWDVYIFGSDFATVQFWTFCTLKITRRGEVVSVGSCTNASRMEVTIVDGSLDISKRCQIRGQLVGSYFGEREATTIVRATLERGKQFFSGVGESMDDIYIINSVRR